MEPGQEESRPEGDLSNCEHCEPKSDELAVEHPCKLLLDKGGRGVGRTWQHRCDWSLVSKGINSLALRLKLFLAFSLR